ncbi:hypothetical protein TGRH88_080040 [Toxoplasma gondii]|uniref:Transmembrane protein n=1 Tax=Toxoplasma gondii TaxID=5811 RepID=A0A7J6K6V0_TOXGO|nr:hypothetical protein TGRH88_080040 [Toxoplasma gondii]
MTTCTKVPRFAFIAFAFSSRFRLTLDRGLPFACKQIAETRRPGSVARDCLQESFAGQRRERKQLVPHSFQRHLSSLFCPCPVSSPLQRFFHAATLRQVSVRRIPVFVSLLQFLLCCSIASPAPAVWLFAFAARTAFLSSLWLCRLSGQQTVQPLESREKREGERLEVRARKGVQKEATQGEQHPTRGPGRHTEEVKREEKLREQGAEREEKKAFLSATALLLRAQVQAKETLDLPPFFVARLPSQHRAELSSQGESPLCPLEAPSLSRMQQRKEMWNKHLLDH